LRRWISGAVAGGVLFILALVILRAYNNTLENPSLEGVADIGVLLFHPAMILEVLRFPAGYPITGFFFAVAGGLLRTQDTWAKISGLIFLFILLGMYIFIGIIRSISYSMDVW